LSRSSQPLDCCRALLLGHRLATTLQTRRGAPHVGRGLCCEPRRPVVLTCSHDSNPVIHAQPVDELALCRVNVNELVPVRHRDRRLALECVQRHQSTTCTPTGGNPSGTTTSTRRSPSRSR